MSPLQGAKIVVANLQSDEVDPAEMVTEGLRDEFEEEEVEPASATMSEETTMPVITNWVRHITSPFEENPYGPQDDMD